MLANVFAGQSHPPTEEEVSAALGEAKALWDRLLTNLAAEYNLGVREWHSYSSKAGWALRLKRNERNILYLSPGQGGFTVSFALGDRAMEAARRSGLPRKVLELLRQARRYAEGTAVRIDVHEAEDLPVIEKLTAAKLAT